MSYAAPIAETYHEVDKLLWKLVWRFHQRYGGPVEDLKAEANFVFVQQYNLCTLEEQERYKTKFTTWLSLSVWYGLLRWHNARMKSCTRCQTGNGKDVETELKAVPDGHSFDLGQFLFGLSDDAREVALLAVRPPPEVAFRAKRSRGTQNRESMRKAICSYLTEIGWATGRVLEAFAELSECL